MTTNESLFAIDHPATETLEGIFFHDLLPDPTLESIFLDQVVQPAGIGAIDPAVNVQQSKENATFQGQRQGPGKGKGPRNKRTKRDPGSSIFYLKYLQKADESDVLEDKTGTIHDAKSVAGAMFRQRFGMPYPVFQDINKDWLDHGEYRKTTDALGRHLTDSRLLLLGCFRILAKSATFDAIEELSNVSVAHIHSFFKRFIAWFYTFYCKMWIRFPSDVLEVQHVESRYAKLGLPGCIGSIDCVHIGWDMCPAGYHADCVGKEGYPTLAFEVVVSHTRRILAVTQSFFGTWNDKTIVKFDDKVSRLRSEPFYTNYKWSMKDSEGNNCVQKGLYLICDGGYHRWPTLIPPYKHQVEDCPKGKWSKHVESLRKDVECTFGILKKRFAILKHRSRLHSKELVEDIFRSCCVLHNMNHDFDDYDHTDDNGLGGVVNDLFRDDLERMTIPEQQRFAQRRDHLITHFEYHRSMGVDFYRSDV